MGRVSDVLLTLSIHHALQAARPQQVPLAKGSGLPSRGLNWKQVSKHVPLTHPAFLCAGQVMTAGIAEILNGYSLKAVLRQVPGEKHTRAAEDTHDDSYLGKSRVQIKHTHTCTHISKKLICYYLGISKSMITVIVVNR